MRQWAESRVVDGFKVVWICPTYRLQEEVKDALSENAPFGIEVTTLPHFIRSYWELDGDGRQIINGTTRLTILKKVIDRHNQKALGDGDNLLGAHVMKISDNPRFIRRTSRLASQLSGLDTITSDELEAQAGNPEAPKEIEMLLDVYREYNEELMTLGLLEANEALTLLECDNPSLAFVFQEPALGAVQNRDFFKKAIAKHRTLATLQYERDVLCFDANRPTFDFLSELASETDSEKLEISDSELGDLRSCFKGVGLKPTPSGAVSFSMAWGAHVEDMLLVKTIKDLHDEGYDYGGVLMVVPGGAITKATLRTFAANDVPLVGTVSLALQDTAVGKLLITLEKAVKAPDVGVCLDLIFNPLSGLSLEQAWELDWKWRERPTTDVDALKRDVFRKSPGTRELYETAERLFNADRRSKQLKYYINMKYQITKILSYNNIEGEELLQETISALRVVENVISQMQIDGVAFDLPSIIEAKVSMDLRSCEPAEGGGEVRVCAPVDLSSRKYPAVVLCGLIDSSFPMVRRSDPITGYLEEIGALWPSDMKDTQLLTCYRMLDTSSERLVFERVCNGPGGEQLEPALAFREAMDAYRIAEEEGVPAALTDHILTLDEGDSSDVLPAPSTEALERRRGYTKTPFVLDPHEQGRVELLDELVDPTRELSATEIESYLQCPYRWFLERRINPICIDATIDGITRGNLFHKSLEMFYSRFTGLEEAPLCAHEERVRPDNLDLAKSIMRSCVDEYVGKESNHVYPLTEVDRQHIKRYAFALERFLEREAEFMPGYHPLELEYGFGAQRGMRISYAGADLKGSIDRIDVKEDAGYAFVIDYKASDVGRYSLPAAKVERILRPNVQAAIYASVYGSLSGQKVVGACYRSITKDSVAGAWGDEVGDPATMGLNDGGEVPRRMKGDPLVHDPQGFADYLALVENYVGEAVVRMRSGDIKPAPAEGGDTCRYCIARSFCGEVDRGSEKGDS